MKCDHERLIALVLGDLTEEETRTAELHVGECQECSRRLAELRQTTALLEAFPEAERRPVSMERILSRIDEPVRVAGRRQSARVIDVISARWRWGFAFAAAAALMILCFGFGVSVQVGRDFKIALGPRYESPGDTRPAPETLTADSRRLAEVRAIVHSEMNDLIRPAILTLAGAIQRMNSNYQAQLTSMQNDFATQRALDQAEVRRNFGLMKSAVDENLEKLASAYPRPVRKIDDNE